MNIVVCTKQVPDTAATLKVDEQSNVSWGDAALVINPWDEYAIEEAIRLKEKFGGKVTVLDRGAGASEGSVEAGRGDGLR